MKACIVLQNQYAKLGHAIAINLKEKHGVEKFCTYIISTGAKEFVESQKDINYSPILVDHELHAKYTEEKLDIPYIKNFEKEHPSPRLWNYLYADRKIMMSIGPKEETTPEIDPLYSHEDILRIFQARAKAIEKMLKEEKPDFILFFGIGIIGLMILYHTAKKLGIRTYNIDSSHVENFVSITENYNTLTSVEEYFHNFQNNDKHTAEHDKALEYIKKFRKTESLNLEGLAEHIKTNASKDSLVKPKNTLRSIKYLITLLKNYIKNRNVFFYGMTNINPLLFILYKLKYRYRMWRGLSHLYSTPEEEDYVFYPLHFEPEITTLVLSPFYFDQVALIRQIARSLPLHYKLYLKEHPAMIYHRSISYYKQLLKIPNVKLVDYNIKSTELIKKSKLITTVSGTAGLEASLLSKPVITFGNVFYNSLPFVKRIHDIETLPELINKQIEHFNYNEKEMVNFVAAIFKDAIPFNFVGIWYEGDLQKIKDDKGVLLLCDKLMEKINKKHE